VFGAQTAKARLIGAFQDRTHRCERRGFAEGDAVDPPLVVTLTSVALGPRLFAPWLGTALELVIVPFAQFVGVRWPLALTGRARRVWIAPVVHFRRSIRRVPYS
jgi:hypothetical protein